MGAPYLRRIGVVTTSRADFGIYRPILRRLADDPGVELALYVSGGHLEKEQGETVREIEAEGWPIAARVPMQREGDTPAAIATAMANVTAGFAKIFAASPPEVLVVLGDRYEMFAATAAAVPFLVPVAHIHGGETTEGAIDDVFRHAITKLAHLHFTSTDAHATRVRQLGEEPWRIHVVGAPSLDSLAGLEPLPEAELAERLGLALDPPPLVVTFHPATLETEDAGQQVQELLRALDTAGHPVVFTYPNADTMGSAIRLAIEAYVKDHDDAVLVSSLGTTAYFSLLRRAAAMVGNTSSGIIESASFGVPVVDIGDRQKGRLRPRNVLHVPPQTDQILDAIGRATGQGFRAGLTDLVNPYGDGHAAERIVQVLREVPPEGRLLRKRWPTEAAA